MKCLSFAIVMLLMGTVAVAQTGMDEVVASMKSGNSAQLGRFFDQTVQIHLPENSGSFSRSKAVEILRNFFITHPVKGFQLIHAGQHTGSEYCIGTLITLNGAYRTTIFMQQSAGVQVLQEIRMERR